MITAYAFMSADTDQPPLALFNDRGRADRYAAQHHGTVHKLVEEAAILRKFDGYVPADQVCSLRFRILELEECLRVDAAERAPLRDRIAELEAQVYADNNEILALREQCQAQRRMIDAAMQVPEAAVAMYPHAPRETFDPPAFVEIPAQRVLESREAYAQRIAGLKTGLSFEELGQAMRSFARMGASAEDLNASLQSLAAKAHSVTRPSPCWCAACDAELSPFRFRMNLCPECSDKRCPRAESHEKACHVVDASFDPVAEAARTMPLGQLGSTAEIGAAVARYASAEVVTSLAAIEAAFEADARAAAWVEHCAWAGRAMNDGRDDQCDAWAGLPFGALEDLGLC
jgi:hypothetical protein